MSLMHRGEREFLGAAVLLLAFWGATVPRLARADSAETPAKSEAPAAKPEEPATTPEEPTDERTPEQRIREALDGRIDVDYSDAPLTEVIDNLKEMTGVDFVVDRKALAAAGVDLASPVTLSVSGVKLRSVLNLLGRQVEIAWTITDEVILLTSPESANSGLSARVYDVRDLVGPDMKEGAPSIDELMERIKTAIAPESWDHEDGSPHGSLQQYGSRSVLIISQTAAIHEQIEQLLSRLREVENDE